MQRTASVLVALSMLLFVCCPARPVQADDTICRELEACCTGIYEELQAAGSPVPATNQCDFAFLVERPSPPPSSCQELLLHYMEFAYSLHENGAILAMPPACSRMDPFTIEPGPDEPAEADDGWTMEPGPEEPEWSIESVPEDPAEPDFEMESHP